MSLLNRGLSFIPTRGNNKHFIEQGRWDIQQYHRRLKLATYFQNKSESEPRPFTPKSDWTPYDDQLPNEIITLVQQDINYFDKQFRNGQIKPNLKKEEARALRELMNNKHIIIKPADKGSVVVIMDRAQYLWEGYRQLNDPQYYSKLQKPLYPDTIPLVQKVIQKLVEKKFINSKQRGYLMGSSEPRARLFYMLPKIHKDPAKWTKPFEIPPGRPIVSDCSSETYYTAEFLNHYINPLSMRHSSYIKDTYDFVEKVKGLCIPQHAMLFTMDIDSLYTNIDIKEGIKAIKNIFQKYPDKHRPDKELVELLEIN